MLFSFAGCNIIEEIITSPEIDLLDNSYCEVPQLSIRELDNLTNIYTNSVYWRVSKGCSVMEMSAFAGMEGFDGAILAAKPVVIYGWDGVPKYFEWRVFKDGGIVGAIVANASKLVCRPVVYVLRMVNSYGILTNYPADTVIIDDDYPYYAFGKIDTNTRTVTEAIDPFAGTNIAVKKEILTLMKERPELFYDSAAERLELRLFTELYPVYSKSWWAEVDEAQMIAVSYLGPLAIGSNKGLTPLAQDWESGRVVDGFTGVKWDSSTGLPLYAWWDMNWVDSYIGWDNSFQYKRDHGWCGPTAGAIMMCYYGYTNKIRWYTYYKTNFVYHYCQKVTNFVYLFDKTIDIKPFVNNYLDVYMCFSTPSFYSTANTITHAYCGVSPEPNNFNVSIYFTEGGPSIPYYLFKYDFRFSAISSMDHFYTRFNLAFNVSISNYSPSMNQTDKFINGSIEFHKDAYPHDLLYSEPYSYRFRFLTKIVTNQTLNSQEWFLVKIVTNVILCTNDGYYNFGTVMGIGDWTSGIVFEHNLKDGLKWACDNAMTFKTTYCDPLTWFFGGLLFDYYDQAVFDDAKKCIERNDPIAICRFWILNSATGLKASHWRVGLGYKESGDNKYILITDNGAEKKIQNVNGERTFINTINTNYSPNIFWENVSVMGYDYWYTAYKE
jgi:hypothetical protein